MSTGAQTLIRTPPFRRKKMSRLEGPKKHHDDHGIHASVPAKGNDRTIPGEHWEKHYSLTEPSRNMELTEGSDFVAKNPTNRKTTYLKVNPQDH